MPLHVDWNFNIPCNQITDNHITTIICFIVLFSKCVWQYMTYILWVQMNSCKNTIQKTFPWAIFLFMTISQPCRKYNIILSPVNAIANQRLHPWPNASTLQSSAFISGDQMLKTQDLIQGVSKKQEHAYIFIYLLKLESSYYLP